MLKNVDPKIVKIATALSIGALLAGAHFLPEYATYLLELAAGLGGWQLLRRHGDAPVTGVHVDDIEGSRS